MATRQTRARRRGSLALGERASDVTVISDRETIFHQKDREISILVARDEVTVTHARYAAGERVAGPHVHHGHIDAFYVLEGELTFAIGREQVTTTVPAGGFVAAPPGVAHSLRNAGDRPARWLTIHARDGGFAAFMRGIRDDRRGRLGHLRRARRRRSVEGYQRRPPWAVGTPSASNMAAMPARDAPAFRISMILRLGSGSTCPGR
jgi:quercetin dioxygenase-like cupin family protein